MSNYIDLHMHSNFSADGEFSPEQLMQKCADAGLKIVALADHNTLAGNQRAAKRAAELGLRFVPAAELDCVHNGVNLHLLGYKLSDEGWFSENCRNIAEQQREGSGRMVEAIRKLGLIVDGEEIDKLAVDGIVTGEMIAEAALADKKNNDNPLLDPYRPGGNRADNPYVNFYWDFCSQGKPGWQPVVFPTLAEAAEHILDAGGLPVLAHPGANIGTDLEMAKSIVECGVVGIEVYSSYHSDETVEIYREFAAENGLMATVGSDFHGKTKPSIRFGEMNCPNQAELEAWLGV